MKLCITGGAGFIGSNLARIAQTRGHEVVVLDNLTTGSLDNLTGLDSTLVEGSILSDSDLDQAFVGADAVVHLAALPSVPRSVKDPVASHETNATGTLKVLEAARRHSVSHLSCASSSSVYGRNGSMPKTEDTWVGPLSPYAVSKLATEQYTLAYQDSFGLSTMAFRFFNVYGPGQAAGHAYAAVIPAFVDCLLDNRPLVVEGDGEQSRDFTFVDTVCEVLLTASEEKKSHPTPVNLAFGTNTTLLQLIDRLVAASGLTPTLAHVPSRKGDVRHSQADNSQLRSLFPQVEAVPLEAGLEATINWFKEKK